MYIERVTDSCPLRYNIVVDIPEELGASSLSVVIKNI